MNKTLSDAISMISYEGQLIWSVFNSMIAVNSFIVAAFIAVHQLLMPNAIIAVKILPILGIIVCMIWSLITVRMFGYYEYWFAWARHCEEELCKSEDQVINKGKLFSDGNLVVFGSQSVRLSWHGRLFRNKHLMLAVIGVFAFLYGYFTYLTWVITVTP